jgi:hypothetical protein
MTTVVNLSGKVNACQINDIVLHPNVQRDLNDISLITNGFYQSVNLLCRNCGKRCSGFLKCANCNYAMFCNPQCMITGFANHCMYCSAFKELVSKPGFNEVCYHYVELCKKQLEYGICPRKAKIYIAICDLDKQELAGLPCMERGHDFQLGTGGTHKAFVSNSIGEIRKRNCGEFTVIIFVNPETKETCIDTARPCDCCDHDKCFERILMLQLANM